MSDARVVIVGGTSISGDAYSGVPTKDPLRFIALTEVPKVQSVLGGRSIRMELTVIIRRQHSFIFSGPKITNLDPHIRIQKNILRLQIPMNNIHTMDERDCIEDRCGVVFCPNNVK